MVSLYSVPRYNAFADRIFTLMLVFRKQYMPMQEFFQMLQYLLSTESIDVVARDFNHNLVKLLENKFLDIFTDRFQGK